MSEAAGAACLVPVAVLIGTVWLTGVVRAWLERRRILDRPVERSSHTVPVPRGGGIAVVTMMLLGWLALRALRPAPPGIGVVIAAAAALALLSWRDDVRSLPASLRLAAHGLAAALGVALLPATVFQGLLPAWLDRAAALLLWVWFINLYNFMDGIDGITGSETASLGLGIALVIGAATGMGADDGIALLALTAAAAGLGFLRWNWHPARIFLGDVGSVPLGYLTGWLLLLLASRGLWAPALILPLYYLADATLTLGRRLRRGERVWEAHRAHFYQRALGPDGDHAAVVRLILLGDVLLIGLALLALARPLPALVLAGLVAAGLLVALERRSHAPPRL